MASKPKKKPASKKPAAKAKKAVSKKPAAKVKKPAKKAMVKKPAKKAMAKKPAAAAKLPSVRSSQPPQTLRGMKDILPAEQKYWRHVQGKFEGVALAYGYERIDTPILEETSLFIRSVGRMSDVVEKELFSFIDSGGEYISLRPEGTASVARAYVSHGMLNLPQPVKLYYFGPMFRYERPQAGRFRQHHQFGVEVFGDANPVVDAELIMLAYLFYKEIGIKTVAHVNSIGCQECRQAYLAQLMDYYRPKRSQLCEDCKRRFQKNPLRLLDCKEPGCAPLKDEAPHIVDYLDDDCKNHLTRVLEYLDEMSIPYVLNPHLVRGLDYYTRTVFELMQSDEQTGSQHALGGGGRYDLLVEELGGRPTPACGFSVGMERAILQMKQMNIEPPADFVPDVFLAQLGDTARRKAFTLFEDMRSAGIQCAATFSKSSLKGQLEAANRMNSKWTLIIGQKEVIDGTVLFRDMESGMQEVVDYTKAVSEMRKKLSKAQ